MANPFSALLALRGCDAVVAWWASPHTLWPITFAWLLGKPSLLIVGGFDTANLPEISYGSQRPGWRRWVSRWIIARASKLATNSYYSQQEIERNLGIAPKRVAVIHHGIPDPFGELPEKAGATVVLSVGLIDQTNLERKGHLAFAEAARRLPELSFVLAGRWVGDAVDELRKLALPNLTLTGWIEDAELRARFRAAQVYVQASKHEGFGVSVAEAMLAGCVPVVTAVGALPEVVGDRGIQIPVPDPDRLAEAIRAALRMGPAASGAARDRVLSQFTVDQRRRSLWGLVDDLLGRRPAPSRP